MQFYGEVCGRHVLLGTAVQAADKLHLRQTETWGKCCSALVCLEGQTPQPDFLAVSITQQ